MLRPSCRMLALEGRASHLAHARLRMSSRRRRDLLFASCLCIAADRGGPLGFPLRKGALRVFALAPGAGLSLQKAQLTNPGKHLRFPPKTISAKWGDDMIPMMNTDA